METEKTKKPEPIHKERLLNDSHITVDRKKAMESLFDYLSLAAYSDKTYFRQAEKGTYLCPPNFCNVFITIANIYASDKYKYNRIRKILKNYNSASYQDVEFLFLSIANSDKLIMSDEQKKQQQRIKVAHGILMKLSYIEVAYIPKLTFLKKYNKENRTIKQELLAYVLDETQSTIASLEIKELDQKIDEISISWILTDTI